MFAWFVGLLWISSVCCSARRHSDPNDCNGDLSCGNYDVTGRDFRDTQTMKHCLLARLNASIVISFKTHNTTSKEIYIPSYASNRNSSCDFNFTTILQLDFEGVSLQFVFQRTEVPRTATSPITYCLRCDEGNWWLASIRVNIDNTRLIVPSAPPTKLKAQMNGNEISKIAGGFSTGVSLKRGYRCKENTLIGNLSVSESVKLTNRTEAEKWEVEVRIYFIDVQPFLVQPTGGIKDPLLCKDYTLSLILIIIVPLLYFVVFIAFYRLRDKYGCPFPTRRKLFRREGKSDASAKPLVSESTGQERTTSVVVTCTAPDESKSCVLSSSSQVAPEVGIKPGTPQKQ